MQKVILSAQLSVKDVRQSIQSKVESDMKCTSQVSSTCRLHLQNSSIIVDTVLYIMDVKMFIYSISLHFEIKL